MIFNISGGGGTALNFRVLAYATEAELMATTPSENTIGIITETPITSWLFSATEPSSAEGGMVWITTGTSSSVEFNALKKNGIQVYPVTAKQYVSGAWVGVEAQIYQGGEWSGLMLYLYDNGDECENITGGWVAKAWSYNNSFVDVTPTLTKGTSYMTFSLSAQNYPQSGAIHIANDVDVTNYNTAVVTLTNVKFTGTFNSSYDHTSVVRLIAIDRSEKYLANYKAIVSKEYTSSTTVSSLTLTCDLSTVTGNCDFAVMLYTFCDSGTASANVTSLYLE